MAETSSADNPSDTRAVLKELLAQSRPGMGVSAQVFLSDNATSESVSAVAKRLIESTAMTPGSAAKKPVIGKVHELAKSFSVTAEPEFFESLTAKPEVKAILPSKMDDVYPAPVKRVVAD